MTERPHYYELECPVRDYAWGNKDPEGTIAGLLQAADRSFEVGTPLAELWMGAHPSAPSLVLPGRHTLARAIAEDPSHFLGPTLADRGLTTLPFLFKVLDAGQALSIQAHPDRAHAEQLHAADPANYPDANHKPELAISLGGMDALLGFRPIEEIADRLARFPELRVLSESPEIMDQPAVAHPDAERDWLKTRFSGLMRSSKKEIEEAVKAHLQRIADAETNPEFRLFTDLTEKFGRDDPGVFCIYFLNIVEVSTGLAAFLGPNEPHAYLRGPILECMAESDNVVRAGLTGKFRDVETLVEMLHYRAGAPALLRSKPDEGTRGRSSYPVPVQDFLVRQLEVGRDFKMELHDRPSILIALDGYPPRPGSADDVEFAIELKKGRVVFLPGDLAAHNITPTLIVGPEAVVYQATVGPEF